MLYYLCLFSMNYLVLEKLFNEDNKCLLSIELSINIKT